MKETQLLYQRWRDAGNPRNLWPEDIAKPPYKIFARELRRKKITSAEIERIIKLENESGANILDMVVGEIGVPISTKYTRYGFKAAERKKWSEFFYGNGLFYRGTCTDCGETISRGSYSNVLLLCRDCDREKHGIDCGYCGTKFQKGFGEEQDYWERNGFHSRECGEAYSLYKFEQWIGTFRIKSPLGDIKESVIKPFKILRNKILERDGSRCRNINCSTPTYTIEVHHIDGIQQTDIDARNVPENLITLCKNCHALVTARQIDVTKYLN